MALTTMIARLQESQKQLNEAAAKEIADALGKLLPEGSRLEWNQYTDYFNDGEQCTFSVHDPYLVIDDGMSKNRIDVRYGGMKAFPGLISQASADALKDAWKQLERAEDLFLAAFGDHITVIVFPGGGYKTRDCSDHD